MSKDAYRAIAFTQEASRGLPGSIKDVADYLLSEGAGISNLTMAQVASRTFVSKPTLVRFAKLAGYAGWTDFRRDFLTAMEDIERERIRQANVDVNHPFSRDTDPLDLIAALARIHGLAAEEVARTVSPQAPDAAAQALLAAHDIAVLAAMQNRSRAEIFASNLELMGILCHVPSTTRVGPVISCLDARDAVVAVSYSGELKYGPLRSVERLRERNVPIIAITNAEASPLADIADHALRFPRLERYHDKLGPFYSGACTSLILDLLYAACLRQHFDRGTTRRADALAGAVGQVPEEFTDGGA